MDAAGRTVDLILRFGDARAFVVGDLLLDVQLSGDVERISPEAPVPVLRQRSSRSALGGAANVAANIVSLGGRATLAGRLGVDAAADTFLELAASQGIGTEHVICSASAPTTRKTRVGAGNQQLLRIDHEDVVALSDEEAGRLVAGFERFVDRGGRACLVLSDYAKGVLDRRFTAALIAAARARRVPIVTDPKARDLSHYRGTTVIKPNLSEGRALLVHLGRGHEVGTGRPEPTEVDIICDAVLAAAAADNVVLSLSAGGVVAKGSDVDGTLATASAVVEVADVSGAGDTMVAVLALGCALDARLPMLVDLANRAAGWACSHLGTVAMTAGDLLAEWKRGTESVQPEKVVEDEDELRRLSSLLWREGRTIVFTNGCFDLLHAGHLHLLQKARRLGDVVVVGVNSDASVRRLKGSCRPLQPLDDRMAILAGLAAVDFVVPFEEDTPALLIDLIRPQVLVKGGDYTADQVVGAAAAASWGGRVEIVPLLSGLSTTALVEAGRRQADP